MQRFKLLQIGRAIGSVVVFSGFTGVALKLSFSALYLHYIDLGYHQGGNLLAPGIPLLFSHLMSSLPTLFRWSAFPNVAHRAT